MQTIVSHFIPPLQFGRFLPRPSFNLFLPGEIVGLFVTPFELKGIRPARNGLLPVVQMGCGG